MDEIKIWDAERNFDKRNEWTQNSGIAPSVLSPIVFSPCGKYLASRGSGSGPFILNTSSENSETWVPCEIFLWALKQGGRIIMASQFFGIGYRTLLAFQVVVTRE